MSHKNQLLRKGCEGKNWKCNAWQRRRRRSIDFFKFRNFMCSFKAKERTRRQSSPVTYRVRNGTGSWGDLLAIRKTEWMEDYKPLVKKTLRVIHLYLALFVNKDLTRCIHAFALINQLYNGFLMHLFGLSKCTHPFMVFTDEWEKVQRCNNKSHHNSHMAEGMPGNRS